VDNCSNGTAADASNTFIAHLDLLFIALEETVLDPLVAPPQGLLDGLADRREA
jgi:hypothetical protein